MRYVDIEQYSDSWWKLHASIATASNFHRIISPKKRLPSAGQKGLIAEIVGNLCSLVVPKNVENYGTRATQHGRDTEEEARRWYMMEREEKVFNGGFCTTDDGRFGASPDGLIGLETSDLSEFATTCRGALELKCPQANTHAAYLLAGPILPDAYRCQVHGELIVTGAPWVDFVSYHPGMDPLLIRVVPDDFTEALRAELDNFFPRFLAALKQMKGATNGTAV